jgi:hypothetical protein
MNRRTRRAAARHAPPQFRALAATYRCPDCLSETAQPVPLDPGGRSWRINVSHDATCPTYRRMARRMAP